MLDQVLDIFNIRPAYDLQVMSSNQDLGTLTARILLGAREIFESWRPDVVLVHGDTTTTFSASLAAFYSRIPVAHVEAGLRTGDIYSPWPEEMNRRLTGTIASVHFAPTENARLNLLREGISPSEIVVTGNTVIDALKGVVARIGRDPQLMQELESRFSFLTPGKRLVLVTGHRRENLGQGIEQVCMALKDLAKRDDVEILFPVHLNPSVRAPVFRALENESNIHLVEPLDYLPFVHAMNLSHFVITDSGGIQEEAPSLGKPVLVLRGATERPEAIEAGTVRLVGTDRTKIVSEATRLLESETHYQSMSRAVNPFGDGFAAKRIADFICGRDRHLCGENEN